MSVYTAVQSDAARLWAGKDSLQRTARRRMLIVERTCAVEREAAAITSAVLSEAVGMFGIAAISSTNCKKQFLMFYAD